MKRSMLSALVFLAAGILLEAMGAGFKAWMPAIPIGMAGLFFFLRKAVGGQSEWRRYLGWETGILPLWCMIGMAAGASFHCTTELGELLTQQGEVFCTVTGVVSDCRENEYGQRLFLKHTSVSVDGKRYSSKNLILQWKGEEAVMMGDFVETKGMATAFSPASNPGAFDQKRYYQALGYEAGLSAESITVTGQEAILHLLGTIRAGMQNSIRSSASDPDAGVYLSMLTGGKESLSEEISELFRENGIAHILSISGLHISLLGMTFYKILRRLGASFVSSGFVTALLLIGYGFMVGTPVSAVRAVGMTILALTAAAKGRIYDMGNALGAVGLFLLLFLPDLLFQASFQLSFGAVFAISIFYPALCAILEPGNRWMESVLLSFSIQVVTLPMLLYHFSQVPLFSIFMNLCILPFAGFLIVSALIGASGLVPAAGHLGVGAGVAEALAKAAMASGHFVLKMYVWLCRAAETLDLSMAYGKPSRLHTILYAGVLTGILVVGRRKEQVQRQLYNQPEKHTTKKKRFYPARYLIAAAAYLIAAVWLPMDQENGGMLRITVLDVGQGDGMLLQVPGAGAMMIDGGSSSTQDVYASVLEPALLSMGITTLELAAVSHSDSDHMNGVEALLKAGRIRIKTLFLPADEAQKETFSGLTAAAQERGTQVVYLQKGDSFSLGDAVFHCLHPERGRSYRDENNASMVLWMQYGAFDMVFSGDLGMEEENCLESIGPVEVLKAAHHGSNYSTGDTLLNALQPQHVIISYGKKNRYGHPGKELLARLKEAGCCVWKTALQGAIQIISDKNSFRVEPFLANP